MVAMVRILPLCALLLVLPSMMLSGLAFGQGRPVFLYPADKQIVGVQAPWRFKVQPIPNAEGFSWGIFQNGVKLSERITRGTRGNEYEIYPGDVNHSQIVLAHPIEVQVRGLIAGKWTDPTIITVRAYEPRPVRAAQPTPSAPAAAEKFWWLLLFLPLPVLTYVILKRRSRRAVAKHTQRIEEASRAEGEGPMPTESLPPGRRLSLEEVEAELFLGDAANHERFMEFKKAYPGIPFERLPGNIQREVHDMIEHAYKLSGQAHQHDSPSYSIIGRDLHNGTDVAISQQARRQGLYIIGTTGTGKSTLLANLILTDVEQGLGVGLIEPKGTLTRSVVAGIPERRLKDVILLDLQDSEYPVGLNLFECFDSMNMNEVAKTASFIMHVFEKVWGVGATTPQLAQVLRNVTRTLIENPGMTFAEIPLLLWDEAVRVKLTAHLTNTQTRLFWEQYNRKSQRDKDELISSTINKVDAYLNEPMIANIVSQEKTTIDFRRIMDEGKILLMLLSPQLEEASRLVGALLIAKLLMAAYSREDIKEEDRRPFMLYCDEFQRFAIEDFAAFIHEAGREFRCPVTLANQTLAQLDEANRSAALSVGNLIVFRVSGDDGKDLAKNFDTTPTREIVGEEPVRAPTSDVIGHLLNRGHSNPLVAKFITDYLSPLESFVKNVAFAHFIEFGCCLLADDDFVEHGKRLLNTTLYQCMVNGRSDIDIPPMALFILGGVSHGSITYIFQEHMLYSSQQHFNGLAQSANYLGRPSFLSNEPTLTRFLREHTKRRFSDVFYSLRIPERGRLFVQMLTKLRQTMAILVQEPILVDTGRYQHKYQQRTYADMENEIANALSTQPNFHAKVKLLAGEHVIRTSPPLQGLTGERLTDRIRGIKQQMRSPTFGYCKHYREVEREIRERQEQWRREGDSGESPPRQRRKPPPTVE
jgi:Type IV secretory system Conjugative DNA transfer